MGQIHLTLLILVCTKKNQTLKKSSDLYFSLERGPLCSEEISWVWNLSSHMCSLQGIGNYKAESKYYLSPVFLEVWQFVHDSTHTLLSRDRSRAFKRANIWGKYEKGYISFSWAPKSMQKLIAAMHWKDWCWGWNSNTLTISCEEWAHWKRPWCWEGLEAGGEGDDRGWDGWKASPAQWTWVWVDSGSWWWTGRPGVLWFMGLERVGHDWATELNWDTNLLSGDAE